MKTVKIGTTKLKNAAVLFFLFAFIWSFAGLASADEAFTLSTKLNSKGITLTWKSEDADNFKVYRGTAKKELGLIAEVEGTVRTYKDTDPDLTSGVKYYYRIDAQRGETVTSTSVAAKTYVAKTSGVTVTNTSEGLELNWDVTPDATGYIIKKADKTAGETLKEYLRIDSPDITTYLDKEVTHGILYCYSVTAIKGNAKGYNGEAVYYRRLLSPVMTSVSKGSLGVDIKWKHMDKVNGYIVSRRSEEDEYETIATLSNANALSYLDKTSLEDGMTYYYKVAAFTDSGKYESPEEDNGMSVVWSPKGGNPSAVNEYNFVSLNWPATAGATDYKIYREERGGELKVLGNTNGNEYRDYTTESGSTYFYSVVPVFGDRDGAMSGRAMITRIDPPEAPVVERTDKGFMISWEDTEGAIEYSVYRKKGDGDFTRIKTTSRLYYKDSSVKAGEKYEYRIAGVKGKSRSPMSKGTAITALSQQKIRSAMGNKISWDKVDGAKKYLIYRREVFEKRFVSAGKTKKTVFTDKKADSRSSYRYIVFAK